MRSRRLVVTSLAIVIALLTSRPAAAKGPGSATITGPGGSVEVSPGNYRYVDEAPNPPKLEDCARRPRHRDPSA